MEFGLPILSIILFSPFLGIALVSGLRDSDNGTSAKVAAICSGFLTLLLSLYLWTHFEPYQTGLQFVERKSWIPTLGIEYHLGIDGLNLFFVLMVTFLTPIALLGAWNEPGSWKFSIQVLLVEIALLGAFIAMDVVLFYIFFEAMLIPLYFLIGLWGGTNRIQAATKFLLYAMVGSLLMLVALIYTAVLYQKTTGHWSFYIMDWYQLNLPQETQLWLFAGFALAFAIKTPLVLVHSWLPDAHAETPRSGAVDLILVLAKIGPYGFIRFAIPVFPHAAQSLMPFILVLALIGIIYGGLLAMVQQNMKRLLAYASVAHMGYIMIGVFALNELGIAGGLMQMLNNGLVTGALFLCIGMMYERHQSHDIDHYGGIMKPMPVFASFFILFSLASIGLPGLNGFVGEILTMLGVAQVHGGYGIVAAFGVIIAAIYMLWMIQRVFFGPVASPALSKLRDLNGRELCILLPLAFWTILLGVYPQLFLDTTGPSIENYVQQFQAAQQSPIDHLEFAVSTPSRTPQH